MEAAKAKGKAEGKKRKRSDDSEESTEERATCLQLSLRPSRLSGKLPIDHSPPEALELEDLKIGAEVKPFMEHVRIALIFCH